MHDDLSPAERDRIRRLRRYALILLIALGFAALLALRSAPAHASTASRLDRLEHAYAQQARVIKALRLALLQERATRDDSDENLQLQVEQLDADLYGCFGRVLYTKRAADGSSLVAGHPAAFYVALVDPSCVATPDSANPTTRIEYHRP